jgi:pseudouridine kinase
LVPAGSQQHSRAVVIGGVNMDILCFPSAPLVLHDSNPGAVRFLPGGVGRNIAAVLALLGVQVELVTVLGSDANARALLDSCASAGIGTSFVKVVEDVPTSVYLAVMDREGDMHAAVNQMEIMEQLTPSWIDACADACEAADVIVLDANLPAETVSHIAQRFARKPLFADPVSTAKSLRLKPALPHLHALKPNAIEAGALTGVDAGSMDGIREAADKLNALGVSQVFVTLGGAGVYAATAGSQFLFRYTPAAVRNATGAGDAFTAGLAHAHLQGLDLRGSAALATALSSVVVGSAGWSGHGFEVEAVWKEYDKVLKEGRFE